MDTSEMTGRPRSTRVRGAATLAVFVLGLASAACSQSTGKTLDGTRSTSASAAASRSTSAAASSSTSSTTTQEQATTAAVIADYKTAEAIFLADGERIPPDTADPRLAVYMSGAELGQIRNFLGSLFFKGRHGVGTWDLSPMVTAIDGGTAMITDCLFDHTHIVNAAGQTVAGPDTETTEAHITMTLINGTWTVSYNHRVGAGCVPGAS